MHNINILLHIIPYDLLLHVSTLLRHHQGAIFAWLKLHIMLIYVILVSGKRLPDDDVLTSKHVGENHMYLF